MFVLCSWILPKLTQAEGLSSRSVHILLTYCPVIKGCCGGGQGKPTQEVSVSEDVGEGTGRVHTVRVCCLPRLSSPKEGLLTQDKCSQIGPNPRSPLSETKSTSSSLSALSDSLNGSECSDAAHSNEELKNLLAPPSSAGSQSSLGSHSGTGAEDKPDKGTDT
ncbi:zinc finger protein 827-like isoform X1 [Arapaima gigas]